MPRQDKPAHVRQRGSRSYAKPPLTLDALLRRLKDRGLDIPDEDRAIRYLRHIGYYRLSPYLIPFRMGESDNVRTDTSFDDVLRLYSFDRALRLVVTDALERVEVAVRAALTDHMSTTYNDSHWYVDPSHFKSSTAHDQLLTVIRATVERQLQGRAEPARRSGLIHRSALEHYLITYGEPELPPSWLMMETLTLGQLTRIYRDLKQDADRSAIARPVGLHAPVLASWLQSYVRVRNICAHHGRLWNVGLGVYPTIPRSRNIAWPRQSLDSRAAKRLYPLLASLQTILNTVAPHSRWAHRLHALLAPHPPMYRRGMGIPENWSRDPFWTQHLTSP